MRAVARELRWVQPHWNHRKYELRDGDSTIARLEHRGSWKPMVYIILDQEELTIRGHGGLRPYIQILRGDQEIARYEQTGKNKNHITFMTGRRFLWKRTGFWSATYDFKAPDNDVLMTFKTAPRLFRSEAIVTLSAGSEKYPEQRILMAFGMYLLHAAAQVGMMAVAGAG
jgi:hypothetical protein